MNWFQAHLRVELFRLGNTSVTPLALLAFLLTLMVVFFLSRVVRRGVTAFFQRRGATQQGIAYVIARFAEYTVLLIGLLLAIDNLGVSLTSLAAVGAVITVGIGFGLQNIAQNFICGLILLIERPVQKGDFLVVGEVAGVVDEISMRATRIISRDGVAIIVPNSELITGRVINQSAPTPRFRCRIKVGVAYGSDTSIVRDTLVAVASAHAEVLKDPAPTVMFRQFGDSALEFELAVWLRDPQPEPQVASDLRFAIDRAFRERKIEIPFPQRDVHVRSMPVDVLQRPS